MTISESLRLINIYPIPEKVVENICDGRFLTPNDETTSGIRVSKEYKLATADIYKWLAFAPNLSENGISFSISDSDKKRYLQEAEKIYDEFEEGNNLYGYKGDRF